MSLEEAQRRNRRRITALAVSAALNHWLIASFLASFFVWGQVARFTDRDPAFLPFLAGGTAGAAVVVGIYAGRRVLGAARATVKALGAEVADGDEHQRLRNLSAELAIAAGIAGPVSVAILTDPVPNALTVGAGKKVTVVVTSGLVEQLTRDELEAVLAVQMCQIRRLDVALQTLVVACATGTAGIHRSFRDDWKDPRAWFGIAVTWPSWVLAEWIRRVAYAECDMGADEMAIRLTRHPAALRRALEKLLEDPGVVMAVTPANAPLWLEPVPKAGKHVREGDRGASLEHYSLTPSLEDRIARLERLGV